jgi:acetyl esterase
MPFLSEHEVFRLDSITPDAPHSTARGVIALLAQSGTAATPGIAAMRRHYNVSRRALCGELEPVENIFHICPAERGVPRLTVFRPRGFREGDRLPALVYLHGGGWSLGSLATYEPLCRQLANAANMVVIWVEYRLAPEHPFPAAYDDTLAAWRWIQQNHHELGADPAHIAIGGDSAGGNLAAAACLRLKAQGEAMPWRQVLLYPCLDLSASMPSHRKLGEGYLLTSVLYAWYRQNYLAGANPDDIRLSPLFADDLTGLPSTILLYAGFDPLRDEAVAYATKLTLAGVRVETLYFADMIHGFLTMGGAIPAANVAVARIAETLDLFDHKRSPGIR